MILYILNLELKIVVSDPEREQSRFRRSSEGVGESSEGVLEGERYCKATAPSENSCGLSF